MILSYRSKFGKDMVFEVFREGAGFYREICGKLFFVDDSNNVYLAGSDAEYVCLPNEDTGKWMRRGRHRFSSFIHMGTLHSA